MSNVIERSPISDANEGHVEVPGGKVWYRIVGASNPGIPILALHGGPGFPSTDLKPLEALATDRPVVFYDQLGCGNSRLPDQDDHDYSSLWTKERFVEELTAVRQALNLEEFHLFGLSWGGTLAAEYLITKNPNGVKSVVLASPMLSASRFQKDIAELFTQIAPDAQLVMQAYEAQGDTTNPEYRRLKNEFETRFILGKDISEFPPDQREALEESDAKVGRQVLETMLCKSLADITGNLKDHERVADLVKIKAPVLFTAGRHDEITPESVEEFHNAIPGSQFVVFENSAHMGHFTETDRFMSTVSDFIKQVEAES